MKVYPVLLIHVQCAYREIVADKLWFQMATGYGSSHTAPAPSRPE